MMFKNKYGRIKKRTFVVLAICLIAIILPVFLLYIFTSKNIESGNIADFSINERASRKVVQGLGFNLKSLYDGNFLYNNSFEPLVYKQNFVIDSGDQETIKILMPDDPRSSYYDDDFFLGAKAEINTTDSEGNIILKKTGIVNQYLSDQIDEFQSVKLPPDIPQNVRWHSLAELDQKVVLGGDKGYILNIDSFSETKLVKLPTTEKVEGLCVFDGYYIAMTEKGKFFQSTDAVNWNILFDAEQEFLLMKTKDAKDSKKNVTPRVTSNSEKIEDVIESEESEGTINWFDLSSRTDDQGNSIFMAVGEQGHIIYGNQEKHDLHKLNAKEDINSVTASSEGFYLAGDNSLLFYSETGDNYADLDIQVAANWQTITSRGKRIMLAGDQGEIALSNDGYKFEDLSNTSITEISLQYTEQNKLDNQETVILNPEFVSASILSNEQLVLLDSRGLIYFSDDLGKNWTSLSNPEEIKYNLIYRLPSGQLIATKFDGGVEYALISLVIKLDTQLEQGEYLNGDVLSLEQLATKPVIKPILDQDQTVVGEWFVTDAKASTLQCGDHSHGGGQSSLKIDLSEAVKPTGTVYGLYSGQEIESEIIGESNFVLKQKLDNKIRTQIKNDTIFNYEFWAKSTSEHPVELTLSFSGLSAPVEQLSKEISGDWRKYQGLFIIPKNAIREDKPLWLQIEMKGSGDLFLDDFWVGTSDYLDKDLKADLSDKLPHSSIVRLDFIPIGNKAYPSESWHTSEKIYSFYYQDKNELEVLTQANLVTSMELCYSVNANPWLIIDSQASDIELRHLMQYLFGQQNTPFGELRNQQGAIGRYSDTFNQIYFEICDQNNLFENDWQKRSYVNRVIQILSETPEYVQIKDRLVFIDGMSYKENIFLSDADYHTSEFNIKNNITDKLELTQFIEDFSQIIPRDPGRTTSIRSELIHSTNSSVPMLRSADVISASLGMMGDKIEASLLDIDFLANEPLNAFATCYGQIGKSISGMSPYKISSNIEQNNIIAFAYGVENKRTIILANLSDNPASSQIFNIELKGFEQSIYDSNGDLLEQSTVKRNKTSFSILPGGVIVLEGSVN